MKTIFFPRDINSRLFGFSFPVKILLWIFAGLFIFLENSYANSSGNPSDPPLTPVTELNVVTWVYLEGAMIDPGGSQTYSLPMRTTLNDLKILPGQTYNHPLTGVIYNSPMQPYNNPPWLYTGMECCSYNSDGDPEPGTGNYAPTVVDWVLVSLRSDFDGMTLCTKAALLHNDGHVEMVNGGFTCTGLDAEEYYLVIEHRNHMVVMSPQPVPVVEGVLTFDFRYTQSYIEGTRTGGYGQKELTQGLSGVFAMYAGNGDQSHIANSDTDINLDDRTFWGNTNGQEGKYSPGDYNLTGDCNLNDLITWDYNNGIFSTVPME